MGISELKRSLLLALLLTLALISSALADKRVALVIGNSTYKNVGPLDNPANDATLMAQTLKDLGFVLTGGGALLNLDKRAMDDEVQAFGRQAQGADVAMFYYAGHGVQVRGSNYLVPVDANPSREADVDFQMVAMVLKITFALNVVERRSSAPAHDSELAGSKHQQSRRLPRRRNNRSP